RLDDVAALVLENPDRLVVGDCYENFLFGPVDDLVYYPDDLADFPGIVRVYPDVYLACLPCGLAGSREILLFFPVYFPCVPDGFPEIARVYLDASPVCLRDVLAYSLKTLPAFPVFAAFFLLFFV
ncbi:MAG: hypothetical protein VW455_08390, partial [Nitrospinota bacterium]